VTNIQPGVRERMNAPQEDQEIKLIVGVTSTSDENLSQIRSLEIQSLEKLPFDTVEVTISEGEISNLSDLDFVESLEMEGIWEGQEGNVSTQRVSPR